MSQRKIIKRRVSPEFAEAMATVQRHAQDAEIAFQHMVSMFVARARAERRQLRHRIKLEAKQRGIAVTEVSTSPFVLIMRSDRGSLSLEWARIWYAKGNRQPRFERVRNPNGVTHLGALAKGAHPMELELLAAHEQEARQFRKLWKEYITARRVVRTLADGLMPDEALRFDPDLAMPDAEASG